MAIAMIVAGFVLAEASRVQTDLPRPKDGFVTVNGIRLHYVDWAAPDPALLCLG
jgi:hypothetical protein